MEGIAVRQATAQDRREIAEIIANAFSHDFCVVTKDMCRIAQAISGVLDEKRFFVAECGGIAGVMACSDSTGRAMKIHTPKMIRNLGFVRGLLHTADYREKFAAPLPFPANTGYFEFVAVREDMRRRGIATAMLRFAIENTSYTEYLLDVIAENTQAEECYKKLGFAEIERVPAEQDKAGRERIYMGLLKNAPQPIFTASQQPY